MKRPMRNCPFCGAPPQIEKWHGGGPMYRLVSCSNEYCHVGPGVCGSTVGRALKAWNTRSPQAPEGTMA